MPLYDIVCDNGHKSERMIPLARFSDPIECSCGSPARRVISRPMFSVDQTDYTCPITGDYIGSKHAHQNNLAKHGCRVYETGETEGQIARRAAEELEFDRKIEATVEREIESMSSDKREKLYSELTRQGVDAVYSRGTV